MLAGEVVAVEVNEARARELEENVRRLGATNVSVVHADGRALPPELTGFDRALVDAPCSGLGVLAARPDLRWRSRAAARAPARAAARGGRARPAGRHDRLLGLHDQRGRGGGRRRRVRARGRADRGVAAVPPPDAAGVPADAAARPPDERLLRRPPARAPSRSACARSTVIRTGSSGRPRRLPRPRSVARRSRTGGSSTVSHQSSSRAVSIRASREKRVPSPTSADELEVAVVGGLGIVDRGLDEGVVDARASRRGAAT